MEPREKTMRRLIDPTAVEVIREIGSGSYGTVVLVKDPADGEEYACKTEKVGVRIPQLEYEFNVYRRLLGTRGIPMAYAFWEMDGKYWLAMQVLGPSLDRCINKISRWDVMHWVFPKALRIIEALHAKEFLHRDIKPDNFLTGKAGLESRELYLVDFGLGKRYIHGKKEHIAFREGKRLTGTVRYASLNTHLGREQGRRDDLESLGYVMLFLIKRKLPWMGVEGDTEAERARKVMELKASTSIEDLCKDAPASFIHYFRHVRTLEFDQAPDYELLHSLLAL